MKTEIFPDDQPDVIVEKFLKAQGEVEAHYKAQPYDLGPHTIKITDKGGRNFAFRSPLCRRAGLPPHPGSAF